jgi:predicted metal-binding membrane protein
MSPRSESARAIEDSRPVGRLGHQAFYAVAAAVFVAAAAVTLSSSRMMNGGMPMPGGWTMGMAWMRMPGQTWASAAAMFTLMWAAMMVTMMLPSSVPMLLLYRRVAAFRAERHVGALTALMAAAYFLVWTLFGGVAYTVGVSIAAAAMASPIVSRLIPIGAAAGLMIAGAYQLSPWKSSCLQHCRDPLEIFSSHLHRGPRGALAIGFHHGLFCTGCCWALMLIQLVVGVMNLAAMVLVAVVIGAEKLAPNGKAVGRVVGIASIAAGAFLIVRSASPLLP